MKIFMFVNFIPTDLSSGITKKIKLEIETLRSMGHEVYYSAYSDSGACIYNNNDNIILTHNSLIKNNKLQRKLRMYHLTAFVLKFIKTEKYDIGIFRWSNFGHLAKKLLKEMANSCDKVVMDVHGFVKNAKHPTLFGKYQSFTIFFAGNIAKKTVDLILTETNEKEIFGVPALKYDNGVDIKNISPHNYKGADNELNICIVGYERIYHGYDRILRGAAMENNIPIKLHFVGSLFPETKKLINDLNICDKVILYGKKFGKDLDDIYDRCNIAAGPVAQHRIGGKEGTGLKTKDYFAKGIPYFYSGNELLVSKDYPYIFKVTDDDTPIDMKKIFQFYQSIKNLNYTVDMRTFAKENFSWEKTFKSMFERIN